MARPLLCLLLASACAAAPPPVPRGADFWRQLKASGFAVPAAGEVEAILRDSEDLVDARDPFLRDEVGYGLSVAWLLKRRPVPRPALDGHLQRLLARVEDPSREHALGRSFAALRLSVLVAGDLEAQALAPAQLESLAAAGAHALEREADLRGYQPGLGWVHATAHLADLLRFLARHPRLPPAVQPALLDAVTARLERGPAFAWGEEERLAQVLRRLALRPDARLERLTAWVSSRPAAWRLCWEAPLLDPLRLQALQNQKQVLKALLFFLDAEDALPPSLQALRQAVLEASAAML